MAHDCCTLIQFHSLFGHSIIVIMKNNVVVAAAVEMAYSLSISNAVMLVHVLLSSQCCKIPYQTLQGIMQHVRVCVFLC